MMRCKGMLGMVLAAGLLMGAEPACAGKLLDKVLARHWARHSVCCCKVACCTPACCSPVTTQPAPAAEPAAPPAPAATPPAVKPADKPAEKPAEKPAGKPVTQDGGALRIWTDTTGRHQVAASLLTYANGLVRIQEPNGQILRVNLDRLSQDDQEYVLKHAEAIARTW